MGSEPPNFSWVLPGRLAGLALPRFPAHYQFLWTQGVRHLVSLTERGPPYSDTCPGLTVHRLRIPDFCPPAPEQIDRFVSLVDEANARGEDLATYGPDLEEMSGSLAASHYFQPRFTIQTVCPR
ncbi:dual specificity protein phosphatase 23 isoform X3 [Notamacropus eugenii]|uniref:dual specificity protein phosphatase 23 isoform X3 n=1 Tax=Notamacropus eugenii TaxID=9315 RepID=UPI003B67CD1F